MLQRMVVTLQKTTKQRNVLHITVDQLRRKPEQVMRCVFRFLDIDDAEAGLAIERLKGAMPSSTRHAAHSHATFDKHNNTELRGFLLTHSAWRNQFMQARLDAAMVLE